MKTSWLVVFVVAATISLLATVKTQDQQNSPCSPVDLNATASDQLIKLVKRANDCFIALDESKLGAKKAIKAVGDRLALKPPASCCEALNTGLNCICKMGAKQVEDVLERANLTNPMDMCSGYIKHVGESCKN